MILDCFEWISGISVSPSKNKLFTILFILYLVLTCQLAKKVLSIIGILLKGIFNPNLLNNLQASYFLINLSF